MIAVIAAMKIEADALVAHMQSIRIEKLGILEVTVGSVRGKEVAVVRCGVGLVAAAAATAAVIEHYRPEAVLNAGVAGGIGLAPMTIVVPDRVVQWNMDTSALGDERGYLSDLGTVFLPCDATLTAALRSVGESVGGTIASGDQFVADGDELTGLSTLFGVNCCDMEAAAVVHTAHIFGVPSAVLRVISDNGGAVDFASFASAAAILSAERIWRGLDTYGDKKTC